MDDEHDRDRLNRRERDRAALAAVFDREWTTTRAAQPYTAFWRFRDSARDYAEAALEPVSGKRVLELAPGDGATTLRLANRGARVIAVELSLAGLRALADRARNESPETAARVSPVRGDVERLPLADDSVDLIAGENFLMYVDPAALGRECRRVLRPGGRVVLIEPTAHHPLVRLYRRSRSPYRSTAPRYFALDDLPRLGATFPTTIHQEFYLLGVLALPFVARPLLFTLAFHLLNAIDQALFRHCPLLRRFGWLTVVVLTS